MIFRVISNLEHNGIKFAPGSFVTEDPANFESLVADNIVRPMEGANTEEEAAEMAAKQDAEEAEAKAKAEAEANGGTWDPSKNGENTWGPKPEAPEAPAPEEVKTDEIKEPAPGEVGAGDQAPTGDNL